MGHRDRRRQRQRSVSRPHIGAPPGRVGRNAQTRVDAPKTPPRQVADGILAGLATDDEDIFPDPNAKAMAGIWWSDPKSVEHAFSGA